MTKEYEHEGDKAYIVALEDAITRVDEWPFLFKNITKMPSTTYQNQ